jgi:hypothetical protein
MLIAIVPCVGMKIVEADALENSIRRAHLSGRAETSGDFEVDG